MARKAFMFTPGDGRPSANAFWMPEHLKLIPKIEAQLQANDLEIVWLHPKTDTISSHTLAAKAKVLLAPPIIAPINKLGPKIPPAFPDE